MNDYNYLRGALDFADKYEACCVTIDTDNGTLDMTPQAALKEFADLAPGEAFTLTAIKFNN